MELNFIREPRAFYQNAVSIAGSAFSNNNWVFGKIYVAADTGNLTHVFMRTGTVTSAADLVARVETVNPATYLPSGTLIDVNATGTVPSASLVANTWYSIPLTAPVAVAKGDIFVVIFRAPTGSPSFQITSSVPNSTFESRNPMSVLSSNGGISYSRAVTSFMMGYAIDTTKIYSFAATATSAGNIAITSGQERGNYYRPINDINVTGAYVFGTAVAIASTVRVYDSTNTVIASANIEPGSSNSLGICQVLFSSTVTLSAGQDYYIVNSPTSATWTTGQSTYESINGVSLVKTMQGNLLETYAVNRAASSDPWTTTTDSLNTIGFLIRSSDIGSGGGGGGSVPSSYGFVG